MTRLSGHLRNGGRPADEVLAELREKRATDARWQDGKTFGLVYDGGAEVHAIAEKASNLFLHENALNPIAFPSLGSIQSEVCDWTAELFHGPDTTAGFMTSGGTESLLVAVKAARERGKAERGITEPQMVIAESAHAAFHKGAKYFGIEVAKTPVNDDWTANVASMADAMTENTVLMVGSAPQYPQGVVDDIPAIAALAASIGASCHVDACIGGFVLPFVERLGRSVAPWDFRVDGVTSISADIHKLGYSPKGASVILHRTKKLRSYQTFIFDDWLGGFYASPNMQGTRSGAPMAAAWAVIQFLGVEGYLDLTRQTLSAADQMRAAINAIDGLRVLGDAEYHIIAISSDPDAGQPMDVFALGDALKERGWHFDRQGPPDSLHGTISAGNEAVVGQFIADLQASAGQVGASRVEDRSTNYSALE